MLILKMMSNQDLPDNDCAKNFDLIPVGPRDRLRFVDDCSYEGQPGIHLLATIDRGETGQHEIYPMEGNAYVMNLQGKTIATRWAGQQFIEPKQV
jgi:hypothetical protein